MVIRLLNPKKPKLDHKKTMVLLIISAALLLIAFIWSIHLEKNGLAPRISRELAAHGCKVAPSSLVQNAYSKNSSIVEIMDGVYLESARSVSKQVGFGGNIEKRGEVYCLLSELASGGVLTVFIVNENIELAFIQMPNSDEVYPINAENSISEGDK